MECACFAGALLFCKFTLEFILGERLMKKKLGLILLVLISLISIFTLSACGGSNDDDDDEACKHKLGEWVEEIPATCTNDGTKGHFQCSKCDEYFDENKKNLKNLVIPASHSFDAWIAEIPATCEKDGTKGYYHCSTCNKNFDEDKNELASLTIEKTGIHNFADDICINCGKKIVYSEGLEFELVNNEYYRVVGIGTCTDTELYIPKTYNNLPVKEIGSYSLDNCDSLTSVTIPDSVTSIGYYAFNGCYKLVEVINKSSLNITKGSWDCGCVALYALEVHEGDSKIVNKDGYLFYTVDGVNYLLGYVGCDTELTLPESYNGEDYVINNRAFYNNDKITSITIPDSVTSIGNYAFSGCSSLASITIPDSVTSIGYYSTFAYCESLTSITIPDSVTSIGSGAFYYCTSLTSVTIPDSVTSIGSSAFEGCTSLTSITIPDSVTSIGYNSAFAYCESLTSITIPDSVTSIGEGAFEYCTSLTSVTIGNSVTEIGSDAFYDCDSLTSITIPDSVTSIGSSAFQGCTSLTSVTIGNGVTTIGEWAFHYCTSLTSVTIGNSVTSIGEGAFCDCYSLTSITIPDSVTSIGDYAFQSCTSLTSVTIGDSVTIIGNYAFSGCYKLVEVINNSSLNITKGSRDYGNVAEYALEVRTGESKIVNKDGYLFYTYNGINYLLGYAGNESELSLPESYNGEDYVINSYAFYSDDKITSITIPNKISEIPDYAFEECTSLTSVKFEEGSECESIGTSAFKGCTSLTSITIPDSVTSIGPSAFYWCTSLTSVTIGNSVTSIDSSAFYDCYKLVEVVNKSSLNITKGSSGYGWVAEYALEVHTGDSKIVNKDGYLFYTYNGVNYLVNYVGNDTELTLPESYNGENYVINDYAFYNNHKITSVTIPDSVTSIGEDAFYGCANIIQIENGVHYVDKWVVDCDTSVSSVTLRENTVGIADSAFEDCKSLTSVTIPNSVTSISSYAFYECDSLTSIIIGDRVTSIGEDAFAHCTSLTSINIPNSVTSIGDHAFYNCTSLTSITIPDSVKSIGNYAFYNCTSLTSITIPNSVTSIDNHAFYNCTSLTSITFADTSTWYRTTSKSDWQNKTNGTETDVSVPTDNDDYFKSTYNYYYWYKK